MVSQRHLRKKPELGLAVCMRNMHVNARLFARKEEEAKLTVTNNGWRHVGTVTNFRSSRLIGIGRSLTAPPSHTTVRTGHVHGGSAD